MNYEQVLKILNTDPVIKKIVQHKVKFKRKYGHLPSVQEWENYKQKNNLTNLKYPTEVTQRDADFNERGKRDGIYKIKVGKHKGCCYSHPPVKVQFKNSEGKLKTKFILREEYKKNKEDYILVDEEPVEEKDPFDDVPF